jgi:hypothetical protein
MAPEYAPSRAKSPERDSRKHVTPCPYSVGAVTVKKLDAAAIENARPVLYMIRLRHQK